MNPQAKHSPGPLSASRDGTKNYPCIRDASGKAVAKMDCSICVGDWEQDHGIAWANAELFAASPELLEALQQLVRDVQYSTDAKYLEQARAAISKAVGGAS